MSLSSLYKLKQGKNTENQNKTEQTEDAEALKTKLEKIAIPSNIAKMWRENNCGKPC
jgi:ribosomal protein L9